MDIPQAINHRRRRHEIEFKHELVSLCQPGVSVSAVAQAHSINPNLLRRWIHRYSGEQRSQVMTTPAKLVPVQVEMSADSPLSDAIEISIQKNSTRVSIRWPGNQAEVCGQWLAGLLE
jgi:transposase